VSAHFARLRRERPPLSRVQQWLSILLAWWAVPVTLFVFWGRLLPRHDWFGTSLHIGLLAAGIGFGWMSYRLARATLRGTPRQPFLWAQARRDARTYKRLAGIFGICAVAVIFYFTSFGAIEGIPSTTADPELGTYSLQRLVPRILGHIGFSPFANLVEEDVSTKPANWTGKTEEYPLVKGARLQGANMQYAEARSAFFANGDLRGANLRNANLLFADLSEASLDSATLSNADLTNANLTGAYLDAVDLGDAHVSYAKLSKAVIRRANLTKANFTGSDLSNAVLIATDLCGTNLMHAKFPKADFGGADLSGADLSGADLSGADLSGANLYGANLDAAILEDTQLKGVDLTHVEGLTRSQIQKAITDRTTLIPADIPP
jgi:uncharacterized protein YjbI with pentapeptide repeats